MEPKKTNNTSKIIVAIIYVFAIFLALHLAAAYEAVTAGVEGGAIDFFALLENFEIRITDTPLKIEFVGSSLKFVLVVTGVIFIVLAYMSTNQKNYINNKEYGTSQWGTREQISHLRAGNIKRAEIRRIKRERGLSASQKRKKIEEAKKTYVDESNIIYTQTEQICMHNYELNNNVMIIGGSGSGKTRGYVLPNILQCTNSSVSPSIVVTDPKGEILSKVGHYLEKNGYVIKVLNLKEQNRSFCFNPFMYIMEERYEEQISSLLTSIFDSRSDSQEVSTQDPFWEDMAKVLLKAVFYAVYECFPKKEQNMATVMRLFRWFEVSDDDDREENPTRLDEFFMELSDKDGCYKASTSIYKFYKRLGEIMNFESRFPLEEKRIRERIVIPLGTNMTQGIQGYKEEIQKILKTLSKANALQPDIKNAGEAAVQQIEQYIHERVSRYADTEIPLGVKLYEKYGDINVNPATRSWEDFRTKCKGKTAQSVTATALAKLAPFDEQQVRRIFSKDELELDLVGERKTALFIVLPPTNKNYNFIANLVYTVLFEQLEYCATVKHNQKLPVPVRFICDEFYNTGRIPNFENILSYARSFGIGISIILQSLDQIKEMYEKSWGTVLDNCSVFLYLGGIRHADTLEYISKLLGKGTFDKKTVSRSKGRNGSFSTSYDKIGRELMDASEIQRMSKDNCLLFISGYQPYLSKKYYYPGHKNYKYTSDSGKVKPYEYRLPISESNNKK